MRPHTRRLGNQALEFALILPALLGLTSGIIDYGWYYSNQFDMTQAARDGARAGSVLDHNVAELTPCHVAVDATRESLNDHGFDGAHATVTATVGSGTDRVVVVELNVPNEALFGLVPAPSSLGAVVAARLENQGFDPCTAW